MAANSLGYEKCGKCGGYAKVELVAFDGTNEDGTPRRVERLKLHTKPGGSVYNIVYCGPGPLRGLRS